MLVKGVVGWNLDLKLVRVGDGELADPTGESPPIATAFEEVISA